MQDRHKKTGLVGLVEIQLFFIFFSILPTLDQQKDQENVRRGLTERQNSLAPTVISISNSDSQQYKKLQKAPLQYKCKKAYNVYVSDIVTSDQNSRKLYTFVKGKKCDNSGVSPLKKDDVAHSDLKTKASILNEQFSSVFTEETNTDLQVYHAVILLPSLGYSLCHLNLGIILIKSFDWEINIKNWENIGLFLDWEAACIRL